MLWQTGLTTITGCTFGPDGSFYASEFSVNGQTAPFPSGDVVRIAPDGSRTHLGGSELVAPGGVAVGSDGKLYVANRSVFPGNFGRGGEIVRIG